MFKIDKIDLKIVNLLMEDGRMSSAEIARRLGGISERVVRYRIDRLVHEKIISISAIPKPLALGFSVVADVFIDVEPGLIHEVANKLKDYECVSYVACAIGETNVSAQVVAHDTGEIYRFVTEIIGKTTGVRKTTTSIVPLVMKDVYQWRIPSSICVEDGASKATRTSLTAQNDHGSLRVAEGGEAISADEEEIATRAEVRQARDDSSIL